MHAVKLLQKCLRSALDPMHALRRDALLGSVAALKERRKCLAHKVNLWGNLRH